MPPGGAALFLLVKKITTDKVLADLQGVGGTVLRTSFDKSQEDAIKAALAGKPRRRRRPETPLETRSRRPASRRSPHKAQPAPTDRRAGARPDWRSGEIRRMTKRAAGAGAFAGAPYGAFSPDRPGFAEKGS